MILSDKLNLKLPQPSDETQDIIVWLHENFQKVDEIYDETIADITSFLTIGKFYNSSKKYWCKTPSIGGFVGWTNIRDGVYAPKWSPERSYKAGDIVTMNKNDGHYYRCTVGGLSGVKEPAFSATANSTTLDLNGATTWTPRHVYSLNDIVVGTIGDKSFYYKCIQAGTSSTVEPKWTNVSETQVNDGSVVWRAYKTVEWKEQGASCEFISFGLVSSLIDKQTRKYSQSIGDNSKKSFTVVHDLNTMDVVVMVREENSPYSKIDASIRVRDENSVDVEFNTTPSKNQYRVTIIG